MSPRPTRRTLRYVRALAALALVGLALLAVALHQRASAEGIPSNEPLYYSGSLVQNGTPVTGAKSITISLWTDLAAGEKRCETNASTMVTQGRFRLLLPGDCLTAIRAVPNLWVETKVDSVALLPRRKVGAVPYAIEADRARVAGDATGDIRPRSVSTTGRATLAGEIDLGTRVSKTAPMTGAVFGAMTTGGTNVCAAGSHPCQAWEAMVIDTLSSTSPFDVQGWVVGSFPNIDPHMRSLANGQHSVVCPEGALLTKYPSKFVYPSAAAPRRIVSPGGLHCAGVADTHPVFCCRDKL